MPELKQKRTVLQVLASLRGLNRIRRNGMTGDHPGLGDLTCRLASMGQTWKPKN
jgi:hypothetical protein